LPTYSYRCTECDNAFDIQQSFTDDTLTVCPVCGGKLRKVFSPVGVTFSGSGFYRTDSRAKPASDSSSSSSGSDSSASSGSSGSSGSSDKPKKDAAKPAASTSTSSTSTGSTSS
jgi:putative FmdB family regulatory protein